MMRRATKIWLTVGTVLVIAGLLLFAASMTANRWDFTRLNTMGYQTNTHMISEAFHSISIETDTADIEFVPAEDGVCKIVCHELERAAHTVEVQNGRLTVTVNDDRQWYDHIGINIDKTRITLYLPEREYTDLYIRESTGDMKIPGDFGFSRMEICTSTGDVHNAASASGEMKIKTSTGDICVDAITAETLELSVSTGDITASSVVCAGKVTLHVSTGKAELTDVRCGEFFSTGGTGDIFLRKVISGGIFSVERSTGDIRFEGCDAPEIFLKTSTGDVTGSLLSGKVFVTKTSTGDVDVPMTANGGKCNITTSTGDIRVEIE